MLFTRRSQKQYPCPLEIRVVTWLAQPIAFVTGSFLSLTSEFDRACSSKEIPCSESRVTKQTTIVHVAVQYSNHVSLEYGVVASSTIGISDFVHSMHNRILFAVSHLVRNTINCIEITLSSFKLCQPLVRATSF